MKGKYMKRIVFLLLIICMLPLAGCTPWQHTADSNAIKPSPVVVMPKDMEEQTAEVSQHQSDVMLEDVATQAMLVPEESVPADSIIPPETASQPVETTPVADEEPAAETEPANKQLAIELEGAQEVINVASHSGSFANGPSFTIDVDEERYVLSEEAGIYILAPIDDPNGESVSLILEYFSGRDVAQVAEELAAAEHADNGEVEMGSMGSARHMSGSAGGQTSSIYLVGAGGGVFKAAIYALPEYFEGHGTRLYYLIRTIAIQDK